MKESRPKKCRCKSGCSNKTEHPSGLCSPCRLVGHMDSEFSCRCKFKGCQCMIEATLDKSGICFQCKRGIHLVRYSF